MKTAIVTGAGGFIGTHFVQFLKSKGYTVIGIDIKKPAFSKTAADRFLLGDLRNERNALRLIKRADELYMFAADMGGVGYINTVHASIARNNIRINVNSLEAARINGIRNVFFASTACVYPVSKQQDSDVSGLKESEAIPAEPDSMYAWEKLFTEQLCTAYTKEHNLRIHVARLHNIYGPEGTYEGGREKSPAALCRKVALAKNGEAIEIWGDGKQIRSYCYIDDCCEGIYRLTHSKHLGPVNIGSSHAISIDELAMLISRIAQKKIFISHNQSAPQGVRSRNSNNTLVKKLLGWEPQIPLEVGLKKTYLWIEEQVQKRK
ncbi:NAD-dependent epimerase/dehydratase family protein [Candidatus Gottesmanbacteria bacterium]|nr:NAD-dependent epimerase/dehydratase family protein [Candidatus Gottesmanbacteria bacterium]